MPCTFCNLRSKLRGENKQKDIYELGAETRLISDLDLYKYMVHGLYIISSLIVQSTSSASFPRFMLRLSLSILSLLSLSISSVKSGTFYTTSTRFLHPSNTSHNVAYPAWFFPRFFTLSDLWKWLFVWPEQNRTRCRR